MEKIVFKKFLTDLTVFFLIVALSLSLIAWIIQSVNYLDFISNDGHGFKVYFSFISLNFPKTFSKVIIFSYFVSLFYLIEKYKSNNEILIFWTNGISKLKFVNFIVKISILFMLLQMLFVYFVVPKSQNYSRDFIRSSNIDLFSSLITEKKFIDTVKDFTIFVEKIDEKGNMKNIYLKDSVNAQNTQIIYSRSGKIYEKGSEKYIILKFGQILDISNNNYSEAKIIKFNETIFNLSNLKTKSTTFPKIQELDSNILISCINNFIFGSKVRYSLPNIFHCSDESYLLSFKEMFNRSIKQIYILILGTVATFLLFINEKNSKNSFYKWSVFLIGIFLIVLSEINSQFLNTSFEKNLMLMILPSIIFILTYITILSLNSKNI
tara:strand:+ start:1006 stop:2142 length:1137 start_codon:yes stop_codon:yes gene_type:complete